MKKLTHYEWLCNVGLFETQWIVSGFLTPFDLWNPYI